MTVLQDPNVGPYDGDDDTLVGVQNNSSKPVPAITVFGPGTDLSGFDGDGICTFSFAGDSYCDAQQKSGTDPFDYEGPNNTFVTAATQPDSAEVDFTHPLAGQGSTYFSLEGALTSASLTARLGHLQTGYVALGDSYSSGEGNPPFIAGTDHVGDFCHRSTAAYPELLGADLGVSPKFYACSGAVANDITSVTQYPGEQSPQVKRDGVDPSAALVTLTIGGNNADFSDVLKSCIEQTVSANFYNDTHPVEKWLGWGDDPSCVDSNSFVTSENAKIDGAQSQALTAYKAIKTKTNGQASIIAGDYPRIFPTTASAQSCAQLAPYLTKADQTYFNQGTDRLDSNLQSAAANAGINFVDVRGEFAGHGICGNGGSYLNSLSIASDGGCTYSVGGHCVIPAIPISGSFHPNADGHAFGYEPAFQSLIDNAANRTSAGYPVNPQPTIAAVKVPHRSPDTSAGAPAVSIGTLTVQAAGSPGSQAVAEDTYQPGDRLAVTGSGFAPGAAVILYLASVGVPAGAAQPPVALTKADAAGQISVTVIIPHSAKGFGPAGAKAGLIFVDAIGYGPQLVHNDDVAMVGLAAQP